jgi:hypothetical protein
VCPTGSGSRRRSSVTAAAGTKASSVSGSCCVPAGAAFACWGGSEGHEGSCSWQAVRGDLLLDWEIRSCVACSDRCAGRRARCCQLVTPGSPIRCGRRWGRQRRPFASSPTRGRLRSQPCTDIAARSPAHGRCRTTSSPRTRQWPTRASAGVVGRLGRCDLRDAIPDVR